MVAGLPAVKSPWSDGHGGTPSYHPFWFGMFHEINHPAIKGYPILGTPHINILYIYTHIIYIYISYIYYSYIYIYQIYIYIYQIYIYIYIIHIYIYIHISCIYGILVDYEWYING